MPEISPDRRNRWYRVKWADERQLKPAWAEKYFDTPYRGVRLLRTPSRRTSHRPRPPAHPISRKARRLGGLRGSGMTTLVPYQPPATLDHVLGLVLDAVSSPSTRTMYGKALADFFVWWREQGSPPFSRAAVQAHRAVLASKGYAPSTINQRLAAIKKLAREAAANGLLDASVAASIDQVPGVKQQGVRAGNWLTRVQAEALINCPHPATLNGKRDRALLALLGFHFGLRVGCKCVRS